MRDSTHCTNAATYPSGTCSQFRGEFAHFCNHISPDGAHTGHISPIYRGVSVALVTDMPNVDVESSQ